MELADINCMFNTLPQFSLTNNEFISLFFSRSVTPHSPPAWPALSGLGSCWCGVEKYYFLSNQIAVLNLPGRLSNSQRPSIFYFPVLLVSIESYHIPYWAVIASRNWIFGSKQSSQQSLKSEVWSSVIRGDYDSSLHNNSNMPYKKQKLG